MMYILNYWTYKNLQHYHVLERQFSYNVDGLFRLVYNLVRIHTCLYMSVQVCVLLSILHRNSTTTFRPQRNVHRKVHAALWGLVCFCFVFDTGSWN